MRKTSTRKLKLVIIFLSLILYVLYIKYDSFQPYYRKIKNRSVPWIRKTDTHPTVEMEKEFKKHYNRRDVKPWISVKGHMENSTGLRAALTGPLTIPMNSADGKPGSSAALKPGNSADGKPGSSADGKPGSSADGKPGSSADGKPGNSAHGKPGSFADGKPGSSADGKPGSFADGKPGSSTERKVGSPADSKPGISADGKSESSAYGKPGSSANGKPGSSANGKPGSSANGKPRSSADGRPGSSANGKSGSSADRKPGSSANGKSMSSADGKPGSSADGKPGISADGKSQSSANGKPGSSANGKQGSSASGKQGSSADGKPRSSADGRPRSSANGKPGSSADGKPESSADRKPEETMMIGADECENSLRVDLVNKYCKEHAPYGKAQDIEILPKLEHVLVDEVNKVVFCVPYKAASTTWLNIILKNTDVHKMAGDLHKLMPANITKPLSTYPLTQARNIIHMYYKFTVVRHPFDRLQSFYVNKFVDKHWNVTQALSWLLPKNSRRPSQTAEAERTLSFSNVMKYTMDLPKILPHTAGPYMEWCHPCFINYDYIAKVETHDQDAHYIITKHLQGKGLTIHGNKSSAPKHDNKEILLPYFRNLTVVQLNQLLSKHEADFEMFGYTFNHESMSGNCNMVGNDCC